MVDYREHVSTRATPQAEAIPGRAEEMVKNAAGGFVFPVDDWKRLERFLILGTDGGTYYVGEHELTLENAAAVLRCIDAHGERAIEMIRDISVGGRAPKADPALFALAMAAGAKNPITRREALKVLPEVARIGTHLFRFVHFVEGFRGWGRQLRRAVGEWYNAKTPEEVAYQGMKYQQRGGWSHGDLLRLAHPHPRTVEHEAVFAHLVGKEAKVELPPLLPPRLVAANMLRELDDLPMAARTIRDFDLPREVVPSEMLNSPEVWDALLEKMPITALIRNLGKLSSMRMLEPMSERTQRVAAALTDEGRLKKGRVHPIQILSAVMVYGQGHGERGSLKWAPNGEIMDALEAAFYLSFGAVEPTGKRLVLGLDVSGSMRGGSIAGVPGLTPRMAVAALAMVTARVETPGSYTFMAFQTQAEQLAITPRQRLDDVIELTSRWDGGGTDCALPMLWAIEKGIEADAFVILTDNETWYGNVHPCQALQMYREKTGIPAKLVTVGMTGTQGTIADPGDPGTLDVVGFDTATPNVLSGFIKG